MNEFSFLLALIYRPYFSPTVIGLAIAGSVATAVWAWRRSAGDPRAAALGLVMRLAALGVIGFLLLGPSVLPESDTDPTRTPVHFLVDASGSMQTADMSADQGDVETNVTRYRFALERWLGPARLAELEMDHDVRLYSFGERVRAVLPPADRATQRSSNVVESTYELLSTMNSLNAETFKNLSGEERFGGRGAVVILSDGRDSRAANPAAATQLARARQIKLHTVTLGGTTLSRDVALTATPRQPYLMINEPGQIDVRLEQVNAAGRSATFRIRHAGQETVQAVALTDDPQLRVEIPIQHAEPGLYTYELSIDPLPGEPEAGNNTQTVFVEVTGERMRVLVLEGQPYWDTKFLAQSLRKDDRIELTQITQINRDRQERIVTRVDGPTVAPRDYDELSRYDVIVLGRGMENVLTPEAAAALPRYVSERGGRVVLARGRAYDISTSDGRAIGRALAKIEPVQWGVGVRTDQTFTLTNAGRGHPVFAGLMRATQNAPGPRDLPTLGVAANIESLKPATRVLAAAAAWTGETNGGGETDAQKALLVSMPYGRGMVVGLLGEGLWRWSLAASDNEALAGVFDGFWSNTVRWLVLGADAGPGQDLSVRLSGRSVALEDELTVTVVQRGAAADVKVEAVVTNPAGRVTTLSLQTQAGGDLRRIGAYRPDMTGVHTLSVRPIVVEARAITEGEVDPDRDDRTEPLETKFTAYDGNTELLRTAANPALMRALADGSGGEVLAPDDPGALMDILATERAARVVPPVPRFVWDQGWIMFALLAWVGFEWIVRKKGGLL